MQSKMTEKEFLRRVREPYETRRLPVPPDPGTIALEVAREAGLEFAPEPSPLPSELLAGDGNYVTWRHGAGFWTAWSAAERVAAHLCDPKEISLAAVARYNAYPRLRGRASLLVEAVRDRLGEVTQGYLETEAAYLESVLAKGPK
jgi:hypothetical protein